MAIDIKFDLVGNPEPPTIILANRNGNMLGQLNANIESIEMSDKFNDASEFSFTLNKYVDGELTALWDKVVDFKLVYCKEWDCWFEIKVELDEATETVKTVFCTQLGQAELSQIMLYDIEINTEKDIERDDYKISILYDADDPEASILNRLLKDKAQHYSISYVSPTIAKIQRSFSFDSTSILDAFQEIAKEIGCVFLYYAGVENGRLQRKIAVYDLQQYCNDCGHRGEYTDKCSKCNSTNITNGYGDDTLIFVTSDELASEGIQLVTDTDSVKNCFKLEAGDDLMTATIRNCNPNGTDYIWRFSNSLKEDMSNELVEKLESYDKLYKQYHSEHVSDLDVELLSSYNSLVEKYSAYNKDLQSITTPITGYSNLMNAYYNTIDMSLYLKSGLMPSVEMSDTNAKEQTSLLTASTLSPVAVADVSIVSLATANSAVLAMAKIVVRPTYKVEVKTSELYDSGNTRYWKGKFVVTNYSDEEDVAESNEISVELNDDLEIVTKQKIDKVLNKENTDDFSVTGLFEKEYDDFCAELKKYALNPLISFHDACQSCIDILIEQGVGNGNSWSDDEEGSESNLYEKLYLPYYNKLKAIETETKVREDEISIISGMYDNDGNLMVKGLQSYIEECRSKIQNALNFEDYLGDELWLEFCAYRREDKYSNDNYISDGLNNAEIFKRAKEFFEVAENEIYKSSELQHSISTTLNNLLSIPKFRLLVKSFKVGNWIRVQVDNKIFKLRLLEYEINFGSFENINVEFSDVAKIKNGITDVESILSQASSMATSYDSIQRQANQGDKAQETINQWLTSGLNSALVQIQNNNNEDIIFDRNGLLCRSYDDVSGEYSPEQYKMTHNIMAYTTDNWKTVSSALGKHEYTRWQDNQWIKDVDYGLSSKFVNAGYITGSQIIGGEIVSSNYKSGKSGTYFNLIDGDFEIAGGNIVYDTNDKALTLKNVTIEWANTNAPEVKDITGLDEYLDQLEQLENQLDGRIQTYSQTTDPSGAWAKDEYGNHIGDLWINPNSGVTKSWNGTSWVVVTDSELKELALSKAQIFTSTPTPPYYVGDLWVQGSSGDILHCITPRTEKQSYDRNDWKKSSKYTDDAKANEAYELADDAKSVADNAKIIGDNLVNGLGFKETEITGSYVISPVIAGGTLLIGNKSGTYAQITTDGKLICTGADISGTIHATDGEFTGDIVANSLTLAENVKIGTANINGLSKVATSGSYSDLSGKPTIPTSVTQLTGGSNILYSDDVSISSTTISDGVTKQTITVGDNKYTSIVAGDFIFTDIGLGTNTTDGSKKYTCISKDGLLTAKNAIIYGTVYATDGKFTGDVVANSLMLAEGIKIGTANINGLSSVATSGSYSDLSGKPTKVSQFTNDSGYQTSSQVTTITNDTISTTNVLAKNLQVNAINVKGSITAEQIDTKGLIAENISGTTITGKTISGGSISIGDSFSVSNEGVLTCSGATVNGVLAAGEGSSLGDFKVDNNSIFSGAWSASSDKLPEVFMCTGSNNEYTIAEVKKSGWVFGAGKTFGVTKDGALYSANGQIGGWNIKNGYLEGIAHDESYVRLYPTFIEWKGVNDNYSRTLLWTDLLDKINSIN